MQGHLEGQVRPRVLHLGHQQELDLMLDPSEVQALHLDSERDLLQLVLAPLEIMDLISGHLVLVQAQVGCLEVLVQDQELE